MVVSSTMPNEDKVTSRLRGNAYAEKQIFSKDRIISWSHGSRFRVARELVAPFAGGTLLDYGCGDATFLVMVQDLFPKAVGADADKNQLATCEERSGGPDGFSFVHTETLKSASYSAMFQVVTCMEVIEHCLDDGRDRVLMDLHRLVEPTGTVIISVPIEIGPSLIGKEVVRGLAARRKLGDYQYKETYELRELLKMAFASERSQIERPVLKNESSSGSPNHYYGHKGFNWRALRPILENWFTICDTRFSPLGWLGGYCSSQVWFICKPKPRRSGA